MKKLCVVCLSCLLMLAGCSTSDASSNMVQTVCQISANGVTMTLTMDSEEDNLVKQTVSNKIVFGEVEGVSKETMESASAQAATQLNAIKGISYEYELTETDFTETTSVDFKTADLAELMNMGLVVGIEEGSKSISLKEVVDAYKASGFDCK